MTLNHPVKALYWTDAAAISTETMKLKLNGHDRFAAREKEYFRLQQPMCCHTAVPGQNIPMLQGATFLSTPVSLTALNFQALSGNNTTALDAACGADDDVCVGTMDVLTNAAVVDEQAASLDTIIIRQATATTFYVGDIIQTKLQDANAREDDAESQLYIVQGVRTNTAETADKTYTELVLDRTFDVGANAVEDDDDFELHIVARKTNSLCRTSSMTNNINMYSFALEPEEHQPSGTCNFSRIDTATLELSSAATVQNIYALNYNVLRIMSGMGGLAYSN